MITFKLPENAKKCAAKITKNSDVFKSAAIMLDIDKLTSFNHDYNNIYNC